MASATRPFLPLERRAGVAAVCFWIFIGASALYAFGLGVGFSQGIRIYGSDSGYRGPWALLAFMLMTIAAVVLLVDFVVCVITFLMWLHRAYDNLPALGVTDRRWSPGWAVGWWFIPIMSLFRPYQLVKEVWQASAPTASPAWRNQALPDFFRWWWGLLLLYLIVGVFLERFARAAGGTVSRGVADWLTAIDLLMVFAGMGAAWCAIRIMRDITERQTRRHQVGAFA
jgi:hypothetical protein